MTYRRLSRNILLASIPLLALVWGFSCIYRVSCTLGSPMRLRGISVQNATIELSDAPQRESGAGKDVWIEFRRFPNLSGKWLGQWNHTATPVRRHADYSTAPPVPGMPPSPVVDDRMTSLQVPVWTLWFPFAAFILAFCRIMEKRSRSGIEKELAETGAADRVTDDTA